MRFTTNGKIAISHRLLILLGVLIGIIIIVVYSTIDPMRYKMMLPCPFKLLTGLQCPACGMQRALYAVLHGHWREAIEYNYFFIFSVPYAGLLTLASVLPTGELSNKCLKILEHKYVVNSYVIAFFVWLVIRNVLHI